MNISLQSIICIDPEIVFRTNKDGTVVVMKMDNDDKFYKINGVAADLWCHFNNNTKPLEEIFDTVSKSYSVSKEKIIADSEGFLSKISSLKLVTIN